jgi:hypothetical protein
MAAGALSLASIGMVLKDCVVAAMESERAIVSLSSAVKRHGGVWAAMQAPMREFATSLQESLGIADEEVMRATKIGINFGLGWEQTRELVTLAADIAADRGQELADVMDTLGRAAMGVTRGLAQFGIKIDQSKDSATQFADAMRQLRDQFGGAAKDAATTQYSAYAAMKEQIDELKESVGALVLELINFRDVANTIKEFRVTFFGGTEQEEQLLKVNKLWGEYNDKLAWITKLEQKQNDLGSGWTWLDQNALNNAIEKADELGEAWSDALDVLERVRDIWDSRRLLMGISPAGPMGTEADREDMEKSAAETEKRAQEIYHTIAKETAEVAKLLSEERQKVLQQAADDVATSNRILGDALAGQSDIVRARTREELGMLPEDPLKGKSPTQFMFPGNAEESLRAELSMLEELMSQTRLTKDQMAGYWSEYHERRLKQIYAEAESLRELGVASELVNATVAKETADLEAETRHMLITSGDGLRAWAESLSTDLAQVFEESFFRMMRGEFDSFYDYIAAITDVFLADLSRKLSSDLMSMLGLTTTTSAGGAPQTGAGYGDILGPPTPKAAGGIVIRPTLALVGEAGPEAIIPLGRMGSGKFLESLRAGGGDGSTTVVFNIQTPDLPSFRASQSQIIVQAVSALSRARRDL